MPVTENQIEKQLTEMFNEWGTGEN